MENINSACACISVLFSKSRYILRSKECLWQLLEPCTKTFEKYYINIAINKNVLIEKEYKKTKKTVYHIIYNLPIQNDNKQ